MERCELGYTMVGSQRRILESELVAYLRTRRRRPSLGSMAVHGTAFRLGKKAI